MFVQISSLIVLISMTVPSMAQSVFNRTLCTLSEAVVRDQMVYLFAFGDHVYIGDGSVYFPFNVTNISAEVGVSPASIFPNSTLKKVQTVIHFRGPIPCNQQSTLCKNIAELVIVVDTDKNYTTFRYNTTSQALRPISGVSELPWRLSSRGPVSDVWEAFNVSLVRDYPSLMTSAFYDKDSASVYLMQKDSAQASYFVKPLNSDGTFNEGAFDLIPGPEPFDHMIPDIYGFAFGAKRTQDSVFYQQYTRNNDSIEYMPPQISGMEFYNCFDNRTTPLPPPTTTTLTNSPIVNSSVESDSPSNDSDSNPTSAQSKTSSSTTTPSDKKGNVPERGNSLAIILIVIVVIVVILIIFVVSYLYLCSKKEPIEVEKSDKKLMPKSDNEQDGATVRSRSESESSSGGAKHANKESEQPLNPPRTQTQ